MKIFIRSVPFIVALKLKKRLMSIEGGSRRESVSRFEVLLSIEGSSLDISNATLGRAGEQYQISRKHLFVLNIANISDQNLTPLYYLMPPFPNHSSLLLVVQFLV